MDKERIKEDLGNIVIIIGYLIKFALFGIGMLIFLGLAHLIITFFNDMAHMFLDKFGLIIIGIGTCIGLFYMIKILLESKKETK